MLQHWQWTYLYHLKEWSYFSNENTSLPPYFLCSFCLLSVSRGETLWMSSLWSAFTGLLSHDQTPADSRWGRALSVYSLPGVLQQPGRHAETHQEPCSAGLPSWLEHQQHLPVHVPHLSHGSEIPPSTQSSQRCSFSFCLSCIIIAFENEASPLQHLSLFWSFHNSWEAQTGDVMGVAMTSMQTVTCIHIHNHWTENCSTNFQWHVRKGTESVYHFTFDHVRALKPHQQLILTEWRRHLPSYFHNYWTGCVNFVSLT